MGHAGDGGGGGEGRNGEDRLDEGEKEGEGKDNMEDAKERLEDFDWEGLEGRFWERMEECRKVEEGVMGEFKNLVDVGCTSSIRF